MNTPTLRDEHIEAILPPSETIRWTGAPRTGLRFRAWDAYVVPFTLIFSWALVSRDAILVKMFAPGNALLLALVEVFSVAAALYLVAGRFVLGAYARAHTRYAVTDQAAYVVRFGVRPALRRYGGAALDAVEAVARPDGVGTIRFMPSNRTVFQLAHPELPVDWSQPLFTREAVAKRRKAFFGPRPRVSRAVRDELNWEIVHEPTMIEFYDISDVQTVMGLVVEARTNGENRAAP